jgi:hypothetical protein
MTQTIQTPEQQKWLTKLLGYTYEIHYKPGKENVVADALSRVEESPIEGECVLLTFPISTLITQLQLFFSTNPAGTRLIQKATNDLKMQQKFQNKGGLLYFNDKLFPHYYRSSTHLQLEDIPEFKQLWPGSPPIFIGPVCTKTSSNLLMLVRFASTTNTPPNLLMVCSNYCHCPNKYGRIYLWTLSLIFPQHTIALVFGSLSIASLSLHTLLLFLHPSLLPP